MSTPAFDKLLSAARTAHEVTPDLQAFCDFPDDLTTGQWAPFMIRAGALMAAETGWGDSLVLPELVDALQMANRNLHRVEIVRIKLKIDESCTNFSIGSGTNIGDSTKGVAWSKVVINNGGMRFDTDNVD